MRKVDRQNEILSILQKNGSVKIKDLSEELHSSIMTLRRDFDELEEAGLLRKVYGGAITANQRGLDSVWQPFFQRQGPSCP